MASFTSPIASFTSDTFTPDSLILSLDDLVSRQITVKSGQGVLPRGSLLGKITATGKYLLSASAASDGSQTPDCILFEDCDTTADAASMGYFRGRFNQGALTFGTGTTATAAVIEGLRLKGIDLLSIVAA